MKSHHTVVPILKAFQRSRRGAAAVELAVVLPVLALLAIGVAEFGRIYFTAITVANAAQAGALYGAQSVITSSDFSGMNQAAQNDAANVATVNTVASRFCRCPDGTAPDCTGSTTACPSYGVPEVFVTDTVSKVVTFLLRYPGLPATVTVIRAATLRVQ